MNAVNQPIRSFLLGAAALALTGIVVAGLLYGAQETSAQTVLSSSGKVTIPADEKGTVEEVRLLRYGFQRDEADSLAKILLDEAKRKHGSESLEAAEAMDLLVWVVHLYKPLGRAEVQDRVRPLAEQALAIKEEELESDDPRLSASLDNMACVLWTAGDSAGAETLAERSHAIREKAYGPNHPEVALSIRLSGHMRYARSDVMGARRLFEQALEIQDRALAWDDLRLLETLDWLDMTVGETEGWEDTLAAAYARRAMKIAEARLGPQQLRTMVYLGGLAQVLSFTDPEESERFYLRGLATAESALGPKSPITERFYLGYSDFLSGPRADPDSAARFLRQSMSVLGENWRTLFMLGAHTGYAGDEEEAVLVLSQAAKTAEEEYGPQVPYLAWILNERAKNLMALGKYSLAERDAERSISILEALPVREGEPATFYTWALNMLAELKLRMGETTEATALYERALENDSKNPGWRISTVTLRREYGWALARMGETKAALAQLEETQKLLEELTGRDHNAALQNLYLLADLYLDLGRRQQAREVFKRCLETRRATLGADHPSVGTSLSGLARLELLEGELDSARVHLEQAIRLQERVYGSTHPEVALSLARLADVALAQGDRETALISALRAEQVSRDHFRLMARAISERRALAYAATRSSGLNCALAVSLDDAQAVRDTWDALIHSRGLVLDELAMRRRSLEMAGDALADSFALELRWARNRLANLAVRSSGSQESSTGATPSVRELTTEELRHLYREAIENKARLEEALAERSLTYREEQARVARGFQEVVAALPENAALVAYVRHELPPSLDEQTNERKSRWVYSAFVKCRGDPDPKQILLGEAATIESRVTTLRRAAEPDAGASLDIADQRYRNAGEDLRRDIWDPVVVHIEDAARIFIVPDGALHLVSFAALPTSSTEYLVETGPLIHYLSTERDLIPSAKPPSNIRGLLALGGPSFDDRSLFSMLSKPTGETATITETRQAAHIRGAPRRSTCGAFTTLRFDSLPGSVVEVRQVTATWTRASGDESGASFLTLTGKEATEAAFKESAPGSELIHVATHGFFLDGECRSAVEHTRAIGQIASEDKGSLSAPFDESENPLLTSGLALAGANHRDAATVGEEDGILTAEEVAAIDLTGVDWAVLSACETGVGEIRAGEGVFGLRRAFQVAGARTLIMSLWSVEDEATRKWMKQLYEARLVDGLDTAESVRQASLAILRERRANGESTHPFYWGAFVAAGDWR